MKLLVFLAVVGLSNCAKLDNTYLPPANAVTAGGSGNFLQTPVSGSPNDYQRNNGFGQRGPTRNNFADNGNNYAGNGNNYAQTEINYAQNAQEGPQAVAPLNFFDVGNVAEAPNNYAQNQNTFPQAPGSFAQPNFVQNNYAQTANFESRPERPRAALERNAAILRQDAQNDGESYSYAYETENGITAEESGVATNGVEAQGGFSYIGDDGQVYSIRYTADQNGFVPIGDHIPTPPPVPAEILKALEDNARDEANGVFDDGTYNEAKYGNNRYAGYNENANFGNFGSNQVNGNQGFNGVNNGGNQDFNGNQGFNGVTNVNQGFNGVTEDDSVITDNAALRSTQGALSPVYNQNEEGFRGQANLGQRDQVGFVPGNQNQGSAYNQDNFGQRYQPTGSQRQRNQVFRNQGLARSSGNRAYLPPVQTANGGGSRTQSFNPRTGYQY